MTTAVGIGLTMFTIGVSDVAAGGADAAEVGAATTAIDLLGGAMRGVVGTLEAVVQELEAATARVAFLLDQVPPVVVETGSGAAVSAGMAYVLGERDPNALAMWGVAGAASGLDGGDGEIDPDRDGVDDPRQIDISFGHGARHLEGTGLDQAEVEKAIRAQVGQSMSGASSTGEFLGRVTVGGQTVEYRSFTLVNGTVNVGTYYVVP